MKDELIDDEGEEDEDEVSDKSERDPGEVAWSLRSSTLVGVYTVGKQGLPGK